MNKENSKCQIALLGLAINVDEMNYDVKDERIKSTGNYEHGRGSSQNNFLFVSLQHYTPYNAK